MPTQHRGYTLTEVMIVLALLAAIAGISWPALMRPWSRSLVQQAAQEFTRQLLDARIRAIERSKLYKLRCRHGTGEYELTTPFAAAEVSERATSSPSDLPSQQPDGLEADERRGDESSPTRRDTALANATQSTSTGRLPHDVTFKPTNEAVNAEDQPQRGAAVAPEAVAGANPAAQDGMARHRASITWSLPAWFYPDGSTSNARWTLVAQDGYECDVFLRGLTGTVRVGPVRHVTVEQPPADQTSERTNEDHLNESIEH